MKTYKNICLFSSGIDSLASLIWAREQYGKENVLALYCNIGQRYATKEMKSFKEICFDLEQDNVIDSRLNLGNLELPAEMNSIIPYRNPFFNLIASTYRPPEGGNILIQNVVRGESSTIDRRAIFNEKLQRFLPYADARKVNIIAPHQGWTKGEICKWLTAYISPSKPVRCSNELILKTVGCYSSSTKGCGVCSSCFRRWIALNYAGIPTQDQFEHDPSQWSGVNNYVLEMQNGKYDLARVSETFKVLRDHGIKIPSKVRVIDLDGTITLPDPILATMDINNPDIDKLQQCYKTAKPNPTAIKKLKEVDSRGDKIIIYTARHESDRAITEQWLKNNKVPYTHLVMGKPLGHSYSDDKSVSLEDI